MSSSKRIDTIEKQKVTILIVISIMILPIWDIIVQSYFDKSSSENIIKFFAFFALLSIVVLFAARFFNRALYLYEENFYIKNSIAIIENSIYLNGYTIQEMENFSHPASDIILCTHAKPRYSCIFLRKSPPTLQHFITFPV